MAPTWDGEEDDSEEAADDALVVKLLVEDVWVVDDILMGVTVAVAVVVNVDGVRPGTSEGRMHQRIYKKTSDTEPERTWKTCRLCF